MNLPCAFKKCPGLLHFTLLISDILLQDNGWIVVNENEEVPPLWFTGTFWI